MTVRTLLIAAVVLFAVPSAHAFEVCAEAKDPTKYVASDRWAVIAEQGKDGWIFAQGELLAPAKLGPSSATLKRMSDALRAHGTLPILVPVPNRLTLAEDKLDPAKEEFASYKAGTMQAMFNQHMATLRKSGWEVPDLVKIARDTKLGAEFFNDKDHHWSTQGSKVTAEEIARIVKASPQGKTLVHKAYTLETKDVRNPGSYRWVVLDRCGVEIEAEVTKSYKAVSEEEATADSLLGDAPAAEIVLIGTSQSRRQDFDAIANRQYFEDSFSALLRHSLQADVLNLAAAGGGTYTSVDGWLTSKEFQKSKPKVVVWEMNDSEGFEQPAFLRSLVPAVHGRCSKDDALARVSGTVEGLITLPVESGKKVNGHDYYVAIKLSDKTQSEVQITFDHGGSRDSLVFKRSPLLPNSGLFFSELSNGQKKPLTSVTVALPAGAAGRYDVRLCKGT